MGPTIKWEVDMAWRVSKVNEQRKLFIKECQQGNKTFTDICEEFGISRPTGYKWVERYAIEGEEGLEGRSRARLCPLHSPRHQFEI